MLLSGTLLTSDNEKISYAHYRKGRRIVVVIVHGFYNSKQASLLRKLAHHLHQKYDVFMFDFRGHGQSSGLFTWTSKEGKDFTAVLDYLKKEYMKIGVIAFSLGAAISINVVSEKRNVHSLICVASPCDVGRIDYKLWKLDWKEDVFYNLISSDGKKGKGVRPGSFWLKKKKPKKSIEKIKIPVLYLHGKKDWVIKPWHSQELYAKTPGPKRIVFIENGPHAELLLKAFPKIFMNEVEKWFSETLKNIL